MPNSTNIERIHLSALDGVRSFACLEIFCCHCLWTGGNLGVSLFLVLSGFLLTYRYLSCGDPSNFPSTAPANLVRFAWKRIGKLYPLHIIMMTIMIIVQVIQWCIQNYTEWISLFIRIFTHTFMIQTWIPIQSFYFSLNGLSWYLSTILFCYFCFPLLLRLLIKIRSIKTAFFALLCAFLTQIIIAMASIKVFQISGDSYYYLTYICPLFRIFDFACGCIVATIFTKLPSIRKSTLHHTLLEILAVITVSVSQFIALRTNLYSWAKYSMIFLPTSCFAIFAFSLGGGIISKLFSSKIVKSFATLTPFIFLIHHRIIEAVKAILKYLDLGKSRCLTAIIAFLITLLLSHLYAFFTNRRKRSLL